MNMTKTPTTRLRNFIGGEWRDSAATECIDVCNPATAEVLGRVPLSPAAEVDAAVRMASKAFSEWRRTPATERVQFLFKLKTLLQQHYEELARTITIECGKTLGEARGEVQRAIENVEVACGAPILLQGDFSEDIASGIDEFMIRQPLGVCACICPFNFPGMIPFWFMPYAIACGNAYLVKPSEKVPLTMQRVAELIEQTGLPKGVFNLVHGTRETVDAILDHPDIKAVSFVGSTPVAKHVYARAAAAGKRVQCQGGAKNPIIVLPDADLEATTRITADSAFGCAGQRCLAASLAVTVGEARKPFTEAMTEVARSRVVGFGLDENVQMGPVITPQSKARIESLINKALEEGANLLSDGRSTVIPGYERGNFVRPTLIDELPPQGDIARTEVFGPVLGLIHVNTLEEAIAFTNSGGYGNMACLFTSSGAHARKFRLKREGEARFNVGGGGRRRGLSFPLGEKTFCELLGWLRAPGELVIQVN